MKKIYSILTILVTSLALNAQITVDNFESGANNGWAAVSGNIDVRSNVYKSGINLSNYVLYASREVGADNWAGVILNNYVQTGYKYLHAYMYRNNSGTPNLKVSDTNQQDLQPINTIVANQWQDVVWDISDYEIAGTEFLMFMVDRGTLSDLAWMLIDEIQLSNDATPRTDIVSGEESTIGEYQLVWNEDFTESSLDLTAWNIETNGDGGGNNELQYYCDRGVSLGQEPITGKHCLILTATKESYGGKQCTSGRVNSKGKTIYTYGKIEARIKMPNTANGLWPAFWQMGINIDQVGWPRCGETDLIEMGHSNGFGGNQDRYFNGAMHIGSAWNTVWSDAKASTWPYSLQDTFHIITMIWTPTSIDMFMDKDAHPENGAYFHANLEPNDDENYNRQLVFGKPNFIIANLAVGGNFPGIYNIDGITALASGSRSMYIDWIRIYQRGDANQSFSAASASDPIEPDSTTGIEMPMMNTDEPTKILHNGQVLIMRNGQIFTITGQRIQ